MTIHLSFTVGPVQSFVAQARRTRDLWAGSWLLSYLAECALVAAENAGGKAIIPYRGTPGTLASKQTAVGGMPNRFEVQFESVETARKAANDAKAAFDKAWQTVSGAVFDKYVQPVLDDGNETEAIWNRQVEDFWETSWVIDSPGSDRSTLAQLAAARKNIRNVPAHPEPGTKCSLMGSLQEISGYAGRGQWDRQAAFWDAFHRNTPTLDVQEGERLCAVALIKRLFPRVVPQAIGDDVCDELKHQESWPSTAWLAALPWLKKLDGADHARGVVDEFAGLAKSAGWSESEYHSAKSVGLNAAWAKLDGPVWFPSAVRQNESESDSKMVAELLTQQARLYETVGSKPVPYYALLLVDGDSMGKLVATLGLPQELSRGLNAFAGQVSDIVQRSHGRTIYAGGDDVLAVVPAKDALEIAEELATAYRESFAEVSGGSPTEEATLSGAIVYAHWKYPLRQVLQTAHHLLDDIAKDRTGRDSLAIGVIQGSGLQAVWSVPWAAIRGQTENGFGNLHEFIDKFGSDSTNKETTQFNASFLYLLREQFSKLFPKPIERPGEFGRIEIGGELLIDIANAELRRRMSGGARKKRLPAETRQDVRPLIAIAQQWRRENDARRVQADASTFSFDGWRVGRFLKQIKDGKVDSHE